DRCGGDFGWCRGGLGLCDPERVLCQRRRAKGDRAALLVVPPDGVEVAGGDFLDQPELQEALADIADGAALQFGGDGKDCAIVARAGRRKDDGLGISQLDLRHGVVSVLGAATFATLLRPKAALGARRGSGVAGGQMACSPSLKALSVISRSFAR